MQVYFVLSDQPDVHERIKKQYLDKHHEVLNNAYVVAVHNKTCSDVAIKLGINAEEKFTGVVVKQNAYNGFFSASLWEKIELWENLDAQE